MVNNLGVLGYDYIEFYAGSITLHPIGIPRGTQFE